MREKIRAYLTEVLLAGSDVEVADDTPLLDSGILDSYTMTQLGQYIGEEFQVEVSPDDLRPENFASVNALAELISRKRTG